MSRLDNVFQLALSEQGSLPTLIRVIGNPQAAPGLLHALVLPCASLGHVEILRWLLEEGASVDNIAKDAQGNTALHLSATAGHLEIAETYLMLCGHALDQPNVLGQTALHLAAQYSRQDIVLLLLQLSAAINLSDRNGDTALHYASAWGRVSIIKLLIERGASYNVKNNQGFTPSEYAYDFKTMHSLQEIARATFEANKKERAARKLANVSNSSSHRGKTESRFKEHSSSSLTMEKNVSQSSLASLERPEVNRIGSNSTILAAVTGDDTPTGPSRSITPIDTSKALREKPSHQSIPKSPIQESVQRQIEADRYAMEEYRKRAASDSSSRSDQSVQTDSATPLPQSRTDSLSRVRAESH